MAALLKSTSIRPKVVTARSTRALQSGGFVRSHGCRDTIVPPAARTVSTVAFAASMFRSQPTNRAPSRANVRAASRPMLPPTPVMMHTLPSSRFDIGILPGALPLHWIAVADRRSLRTAKFAKSNSRKLVKEEIDGGDLAVPGDDEIGSGVSRRLARAARHPANPPPIAHHLRRG